MRYSLATKSLVAMVALAVIAGCASAPKPGGADSAKTSPTKKARKRPTVASTPEQRQKFAQAVADIQSGKLENAQKSLTELVAAQPEFAAAHNNLGIVYRQRGEFSKAEDAYKAALAADPDNLKAHLNLGILYDIYLQQPSLALDHYQRYQELVTESDKEVALWIAELKQRL